MNRCLQLAQMGAGKVAPNPMVGAVLVYKDTIIGEGYHQQYGKAHAEVNCINSVADENIQLIESSTLYVSLEPCTHFGKTPPCADRIIKHKIPEVVVACRDTFEKVNGHGIQRLRDAGINVTEGVLEKEAVELNKRFFCFHQKKRPYIFLKWAQSIDGFIARNNFEKVAISNEFTNRLMHELRTQEAAIIVGTNTALHDNPSLTARLWPGKNPLRIIIDKQLRQPLSSAIFNDEAPTIILNFIKEEKIGTVYFHKVEERKNMLSQLMEYLFENEINSLVVEGGAVLLKSFLKEGLWDEAIVITNTSLAILEGVTAPDLPRLYPVVSKNILSDQIQFYRNQ